MLISKLLVRVVAERYSSQESSIHCDLRNHANRQNARKYQFENACLAFRKVFFCICNIFMQCIVCICSMFLYMVMLYRGFHVLPEMRSCHVLRYFCSSFLYLHLCICCQIDEDFFIYLCYVCLFE